MRSVGGVALGGAAVGALGAGASARADVDTPSIVGAWLVTALGQTTRPITVLMFFHDDGIVQHVDGPRPRTHDPEETVEYQSVSGGQWTRTGFNDYVYTRIGIDYDARGTPFALDTTRGVLTFDPLNDRWTATITLTETELDGTPTGGGRTGTVTGRRVGGIR